MKESPELIEHPGLYPLRQPEFKLAAASQAYTFG
jgi:hypothetical protein